MKNIKIKVDYNHADFVGIVENIMSGTRGAFSINFEFSKEWDGFTKTAILYADKYSADTAAAIILDDDNRIAPEKFPPQLIAKKCDLHIGVFGTDANGIQFPTNEVCIHIKKGVPTDGVEMQIDTSLYSQIIAIMNATKSIAEDVQSKAENGEFSYVLTDEDKKEIADSIDTSGLVPTTRKVANKELKEDVTANDILQSFFDATEKQPLSALEMLLSKSVEMGKKANKTEALKSVQIALNSNSVRLEYADGSTAYSNIYGLEDLLEQIESKAEKAVWRKLNEFTVEEATDLVICSEDSDGNQFSIDEAIVIITDVNVNATGGNILAGIFPVDAIVNTFSGVMVFANGWTANNIKSGLKLKTKNREGLFEASAYYGSGNIKSNITAKDKSIEGPQKIVISTSMVAESIGAGTKFTFYGKDRG